MAADKNTIAKTLSPADLEAFVDECWHTQGLTLAKIQELAAARGIEISLMSATSFRDTTFARHVARIKRARELQEQLAEVRKGGGSIVDGVGSVLEHELFDALTAERETGDALGLESMDVISKVFKRLSGENRANRESETRIKALEAQLREKEAKEEERKAKTQEARTKLARAKDGGLSPDTLRTIEEALNL